MAFWNDLTVVVKQSHRWVVSFSLRNESPVINQYLVKSIDQPSYEIGTVQAKHLFSHTYNFPKRLTWKPISMVLYDAGFTNTQLNILHDAEIGGPQIIIGTPHKKTNSTQTILYKFLETFNYFPPKESVRMNDQSLSHKTYHFKENMIGAITGRKVDPFKKANPQSIHFMQVYQLDGEGNIIDNWKLYNPILVDYKPDKLDYQSDAPMTISVTIAYDWAEIGGKLFGEDKKRQDGTIKGGPLTIKDSQGLIGPDGKPITAEKAAAEIKAGRLVAADSSAAALIAAGTTAPAPTPPTPTPPPSAVSADGTISIGRFTGGSGGGQNLGIGPLTPPGSSARDTYTGLDLGPKPSTQTYFDRDPNLNK